jgi:CubicO group peptidase (beta-lactamase class C family)
MFTACARPGLPPDLRGVAKEVKELCDACDNPSIPGGYAVAVVKDGRVLYQGAYGSANNELEAPFTIHTVSNLASVSKQFTGFAIATLVHEGKLDPDDDIRRYVPELPDFGEPITVRQLLYHTSGIRDWFGLVKLSGRFDEDVITDDFLLKLALNQRDLNFRPGERAQYSNTGYFLLAVIVSRVSGQPFSEWMRDNVFVPLGMNDTRICDDYRAIIPNLADSYRKDSNGVIRKTGTGITEAYGSSSLLSTLADMIKWVSNFETREVGSPEVWDMMLQSGTLNDGQEVNYGFGLSIQENDGVQSIGHGGSYGGYLSQLTYYPELHLGYVFMTNRDPSGVYLDDDIVRLFLPDTSGEVTEGQAESAERKVAVIDPGLFDEYAGAYEFYGGVVTIKARHDRLQVRLPWETTDFFPESDSKFFRKDFDAQFEFFRNDEGNVDRLVYYFRGAPNPPFGKLDWRVSGYTDLEEVLGEYECPELRTRYTVMIRDSRLVLWHLQNEEVWLLRLDRDHYLGDKWWCEEIEILRDEEDNVAGFTLTADGGNIRNLAFEKL